MTDLTGRDDGWGVTDEYAIDEFYTRSTDHRGHSDNMRVRVKPDVAGEIGALVSSRLIPEYRTPADVIRDALVHRLRWIAENTDNPAVQARLSEMVRRTAIEETTGRYTQLIDSFEEFVGRTREVCDRALRFEDHHGVAAYLHDVVEYAANTREPYSTMLLKVVEHYRSQLKLDPELLPDMPLDGGVGSSEPQLDPYLDVDV